MSRLLLSFLGCLALGALAADPGILSRLRLQMALQQMETANMAYTHWVCANGRRQKFFVCQWREEEGSTLRWEQVKYPKAERDRMRFWGYSREVRYTGENGTTIAFFGPLFTRLIHMPWSLPYPYLDDAGEFSSQEVTLQGRLFWRICCRNPGEGTAEDFWVERSPGGGRLRRWRRFGQEGALWETHLYEEVQELPTEYSTPETFLPPEEGLRWEVETWEEYHQARQEIRQQEEKERMTGRRSIPFPRSREEWRAVLVTPFQTPSRLILMALAALSALLLFVLQKSRRSRSLDF